MMMSWNTVCGQSYYCNYGVSMNIWYILGDVDLTYGVICNTTIFTWTWWCVTLNGVFIVAYTRLSKCRRTWIITTSFSTSNSTSTSCWAIFPGCPGWLTSICNTTVIFNANLCILSLIQHVRGIVCKKSSYG